MANTSLFIIPFASSLDEQCKAAIKTLALPNLARFLKQAQLTHMDLGDAFDFIAPHERALGLTDQVIVTPCHWSVGIDNIRMDNPDDLQLTDAESRALFALVTPYFSEDGITLTYQSAMVWHASSVLFEGLPLASLDRAIGRNVDVWQPPAEQSRRIRRLQNEIQMLLYTHPANDAREARGLPTVNSFWLSRPVCEPDGLHVVFDLSLREPAMRANWSAWVDGWKALDSKLSEASCPASPIRPALQLILCGERHSSTFRTPARRTLMQQAKHFFQTRHTVALVLASL